jgi:hypothetical protein
MSILGRVMLVLVFLCSLGMFYLAVRALKTQDVYRTEYNWYAQKVDELTKKVIELEGKDEQLGQKVRGIVQLDRLINVVITNRGRAWFDCTLADNKNNQFVVQVDNPNPHLISDKNVLHVFEQAPDLNAKGIFVDQRVLRYIGEFRVGGVNAAQVTLIPGGYDPQKPVPTVVQMQVARMANAQGPLALYEQLPIDIHEVWMSAKELYPDPQAFVAAFFPESMPEKEKIRAEFLRHGGPADANDPPERILVGVRFNLNYADLPADKKAELSAQGFNEVNEITPAGDVLTDDQGNPRRIQVFNVIKKDDVAYFLLGSPDRNKPEGPAGWLTRTRVGDVVVGQEVSRTYHRPLRDYGLFFRQVARGLPVLENRRGELILSIDSKKKEQQLIEGNQTYERGVKQELETEKTTVGKERAVVQQLQKELEVELTDAHAKIAKLDVENQKLAEEYRRLQIAQADRINRDAREKSSTQKTSTSRSSNPEKP